MKILWFSHIKFKQDKNLKFNYPGGNWVTSLLKLVEQEITLRIVFFGETDAIYKNEYGTTFQEISVRKQNRISDIIERWQHKIDNENQIAKLLTAINDYEPDLIQIFGTESAFGIISRYIKIPVIIHLQGIINPCLNAWMIPGLNNSLILKKSNLSFFLRGAGLYHDYYRFKKMAKRELQIFSNCNYFLGRTSWDKQMCKLYAPHAQYYHCDEVIRESFYETKWELPKNNKLIIASTINSNIYKGLDVILKTAIILKNHTSLEFIWDVYGITESDEYSKIVSELVQADFSSNFIQLKGLTTEKNLIDGLCNSNLFIHCSYIDNSPNSICEAQLIGLPVISTNTGGVSSLITHGENGFLVPANEPQLMASQIIEMSTNEIILKKISQNSRIEALKRHDRLKIKNDLLEIYKSIVSN